MCLFLYPSYIKSTLSKSALKIEYPLCHAVALGKQSADAGKVGACIDARRGRLMGDEHCNAFSVPECASLFERLNGFYCRGRYLHDAAQECWAASVQANVAIHCMRHRERRILSVPACGPSLEIPRDWRARKIQGMTARVEHRLDNIRI